MVDYNLVARTIELYTQRCEQAANINQYQAPRELETQVFASAGVALQKDEKIFSQEYLLTLPIPLKRLNDLLGETAPLSNGEEFYYLPPNVARIVDRPALNAGINSEEIVSADSVRITSHMFSHTVGFMKLYGKMLRR